MKKLRKNFKKAVLMFIIVFLLLLEFRNFKLIDALVQRTNQQTNYTQQLEQEVVQLKTDNARLESNVVYEYNKVQALSNKPAQIKYITVKQQVEPKQDKVQHSNVLDELSPSSTVTTTVGILATLEVMIKNIAIFSLTSR